MAAPPYMKLFWGDYHKATRHLRRDQHGAYFLLIGEAWRLGGSLPDDDTMLAAWALCSPDEWAATKPVVMAFFALRRGKWVHDRVREELASYETTSRKRKEAGRKGGASSHGKDKGNTEAIAIQLPTKPEPEPEPKKDPPKAPKGALVPEGLVERVWSAIPPKSRARTSRADIASAMRAAADRGRDPEAIAATLTSYYATADATKEGGQFAKTAHRLIERDRWLDLAAPTPLEALAARPDPDAVWRRRVQAWQSGSRYWNTIDWEAPPGKPGCIVPVQILAEFNITPPLTAANGVAA